MKINNATHLDISHFNGIVTLHKSVADYVRIYVRDILLQNMTVTHIKSSVENSVRKYII